MAKNTCKAAGRNHANPAAIARNAELRKARHERTMARRQQRAVKTMAVELDDCTVIGATEVVRHLVQPTVQQPATEQPSGMRDQLKVVRREMEIRQAYEWQQYCARIDSMRELCAVVFKGRDDIAAHALDGGLHSCCADQADYDIVMPNLRFALADATAYRMAVRALCGGAMIGVVPRAVELATAK